MLILSNLLPLAAVSLAARPFLNEPNTGYVYYERRIETVCELSLTSRLFALASKMLSAIPNPTLSQLSTLYSVFLTLNGLRGDTSTTLRTLGIEMQLEESGLIEIT